MNQTSFLIILNICLNSLLLCVSKYLLYPIYSTFQSNWFYLEIISKIYSFLHLNLHHLNSSLCTISFLDYWCDIQTYSLLTLFLHGIKSIFLKCKFSKENANFPHILLVEILLTQHRVWHERIPAHLPSFIFCLFHMYHTSAILTCRNPNLQCSYPSMVLHIFSLQGCNLYFSAWLAPKNSWKLSYNHFCCR